MIKNLPTMQETWVRSLSWEDPLEKGTATHSSILALENSTDCIVHSSWGRKESDMTKQLSLPIHGFRIRKIKVVSLVL